MSRWVTVLAIVLAVIALLVVAMLLAGGPGGHTPRRHGGLESTQWNLR